MVTLKDVAKESGYSTNTISRFINKKGYIGKEASLKIKKAIEELNYIPYIGGRLITKAKSKLISFILYNIIGNEFYIESLRAADKILIKNGYNSLVFNFYANFLLEKRYLELSSSFKVDGIVMSNFFGQNKKLIDSIINRNKIPIVIMENYTEGIKANYVLYEEAKGSYLLTEHLIKSHNKKRIAAIFPIMPEGYNNRFIGYKRALEEYNLPYDKDIVSFCDVNSKSGYNFTKKVIEMGIDSIFSGVTVFSPGIMQALTELNILYPKDISFVTWDDYDINTLSHPYITSLKRFDKECGKLVSNILIDNINKGKIGKKIIKIDTELNIRESCGCSQY